MYIFYLLKMLRLFAIMLYVHKILHLYTKNITMCHFKPITDPKTCKKRVIQI